MNLESNAPVHPTTLRARANATGLVILLGGFIAAVWIWFTQPAENEKDLAALGLALSPDDSAKYQRQVEIYYGKVGVLGDRWTRTLAELTHGRALAGTVAVLAFASATACFAFGHLMKKVAERQR